jgi:hypothetical protein
MGALSARSPLLDWIPANLFRGLPKIPEFRRVAGLDAAT